MITTSTTPNEPFDPRHNITDKEIDRDLLNLTLPAIDLIATEEECEALYSPGVYQQMMKEILGPHKTTKTTDAS
jgi:hypothetical protein